MNEMNYKAELLEGTPSGNGQVASTLQIMPETKPDDDFIELNEEFDFEGFQVVRREFFAHLNEPAVCFNNYKFNVNTSCLQKFPQAEAVQVLINQETKKLALIPCPENVRDSFAWCTNSKGKRKPRQVTGRLFFLKVVNLMGWNPDYKYKVLGKLIRANDMEIIVFDLRATETYQRTITEGEKPKTSRTPVFPKEWQDQFGLPYYEHRDSMQVNIFDGYAVISVKDPQPSRAKATLSEEAHPNAE